MSSRRRVIGGCYWLVLLVAIMHGDEARAENKIGVAANVTNQVVGVVQASPKPLSNGSDIFSDQIVRTGYASSAQLKLFDQTIFSLGPNSEAVVDRFVYERDQAAGEVIIKTTHGIFRLVTGSLTPSSYQIKTPIATVGVARRAILDFILAEDRMTLLLVSGKSDVTMPNGQLASLTEPGSAIIVYRDGHFDAPKRLNAPLADSTGFSFPPHASLADITGSFIVGSAVGGQVSTVALKISNSALPLPPILPSSVSGMSLPLAALRSGKASTAQLIFLDQINFSLGPNAQSVLDRFVFEGRASGIIKDLPRRLPVVPRIVDLPKPLDPINPLPKPLDPINPLPKPLDPINPLPRPGSLESVISRVNIGSSVDRQVAPVNALTGARGAAAVLQPNSVSGNLAGFPITLTGSVISTSSRRVSP